MGECRERGKDGELIVSSSWKLLFSFCWGKEAGA